MRTAILAGALLAFALSFDEVIVTFFVAGGVRTLPIWILQSFRLANQVALVNVAGLVAILLSVIPVYIATRVSTDAGAAGRTCPVAATGSVPAGAGLHREGDRHEDDDADERARTLRSVSTHVPGPPRPS